MLYDTPICDFGWPTPDFTLNDTAGTSHSLRTSLGHNGLLIAFICNHCPYVQAIGKRLASDAAILMAEGINVLAVMSNDFHRDPDDSPVNMEKFAAHFGFNFPYLVDEDQAVGPAYGAVCTPDFFGFNKDGGLQYRGRLDDAKMGNDAGRVPELLNAMRQIAAKGRGPQEQVSAMGCSIKWR